MRVFIVGAGEVGFNTAQMLSREGHDVIVVDQDERRVSRASEQLDALVMQGNGASPKLLSEVGTRKADLLIAVTNTDEVNITACLVAKAQGVKRTVARIRNPDYYDAKEAFAKDVLGIDFVIHTERAAAEEIRDALRVPGAVTVEGFAEDAIEVAEVVLKEESPAAGKAVKDVELPKGSLVIGVVRNGETIVPSGDTTLEAGDHMFLIGETRHIQQVVGAVAIDTEKVREVMIFGGGKIGLRLALLSGSGRHLGKSRRERRGEGAVRGRPPQERTGAPRRGRLQRFLAPGAGGQDGCFYSRNRRRPGEPPGRDVRQATRGQEHDLHSEQGRVRPTLRSSRGGRGHLPETHHGERHPPVRP